MRKHVGVSRFVGLLQLESCGVRSAELRAGGDHAGLHGHRDPGRLRGADRRERRASASARTSRASLARPFRPWTASRSTSTSHSRPRTRTATLRRGPVPVMMLFHGYAGSKLGLRSMRHWLDQGYATFSMTTRGNHQSCGTTAARDRRRRRVRRRLRPPDGHPLRGARRTGLHRAPRGRGARRSGRDRRERRLVRRRHVDGARRAQEPPDAPRRQPDGLGVAGRHARSRSRARLPRSRGPTSRTRWSPTAAPSTTSPMLRTSATSTGSASRRRRYVNELYAGRRR